MLINTVKVALVVQVYDLILNEDNDVNTLLDAFEALGGDTVELVRGYVEQTKSTQDSN